MISPWHKKIGAIFFIFHILAWLALDYPTEDIQNSNWIHFSKVPVAAKLLLVLFWIAKKNFVLRLCDFGCFCGRCFLLSSFFVFFSEKAIQLMLISSCWLSMKTWHLHIFVHDSSTSSKKYLKERNFRVDLFSRFIFLTFCVDLISQIGCRCIFREVR